MVFDLIYVQELDHILQNAQSMLIDIREPEAYRYWHWRGAVNYPYAKLKGGRIQLPKNRKLILYCEHGGSSMELARCLGHQGYSVASVVGGSRKMQEYLQKGRR